MKSLKALGVSAWASVDILSDLAGVGPFEYYDPNTDGRTKGDARNYVIGPLDWKPTEDVPIMPNAIVEMYETSRGGRSYHPSVTARLTLYYVFL